MANKGDPKGREGSTIFRRFSNIVHHIQSLARRLYRVSRISATAEIIAAANATSTGIYLKALITEIHEQAAIDLAIHSAALQSLSNSLKELEVRYNKVELAAILEVFNNGNLNAVHWCTRKKLLADRLTKNIPPTKPLLLEALTPGKPERPLRTKTNHGLPQTDTLRSLSENQILAKRGAEK